RMGRGFSGSGRMVRIRRVSGINLDIPQATGFDPVLLYFCFLKILPDPADPRPILSTNQARQLEVATSRAPVTREMNNATRNSGGVVVTSTGLSSRPFTASP